MRVSETLTVYIIRAVIGHAQHLLKCTSISTRLRGTTSQTKVILIFAAVRTWNITTTYDVQVHIWKHVAMAWPNLLSWYSHGQTGENDIKTASNLTKTVPNIRQDCYHCTNWYGMHRMWNEDGYECSSQWLVLLNLCCCSISTVATNSQNSLLQPPCQSAPCQMHPDTRQSAHV
jgi:hypothetical protein